MSFPDQSQNEEKQNKSKHRLPLVASDLQISILSLSADSITPMSWRYAVVNKVLILVGFNIFCNK